MAKKNRKLLVPEETTPETPMTETPTPVAEAAAEEKPKKEKRVVEYITTPSGEQLRLGTVIAETIQLFNRPAEEALTFEQIVDKLCEKFPKQPRGRHMFTVRRRVNSFKRFGYTVGVDAQKRISFHIPPGEKLGRVVSPEQEEARAKAKAEREAAKLAAKEEREKRKAEKAAAKEAAKAAKEAAKAEAKEKAEALKRAKENGAGDTELEEMAEQ